MWRDGGAALYCERRHRINTPKQFYKVAHNSTTMCSSQYDGKYPQQASAIQRPSPSNKRRSLLNSQMKGIVVTSTSGITGKGKAKTRLTLICFNKRQEKRGGWVGGNTAEEMKEEADGTRRRQLNSKMQNLNIWQRQRRAMVP